MARVLSLEDKLKETFDYNPETGVFTYKQSRPPDHFKTISSMKRWHTLFAGEVIYNPDTVNGNTYNRLNMDGQKHRAHRVAWLIMVGEWPKGEVDHLNRDGLDNRFCNLRDVDKSENMRNASLKYTNKSGTKDVRRRENGRWIARGNEWNGSTHNRVYLGTFDTKEEAVQARLVWEQTQGSIF